MGRVESILQSVMDAELPLVIANRRPHKIGDVDLVVANNTKGARTATRYLLSKGRRRIIHLAGPEYATLSQERLEGYRQALVEAAIGVDEGLVVRGPFTHKSGYGRRKRILAGAKSLDAIFAVYGVVALGAMHAIIDSALHIPEDLALVVFDDIDLCPCQAIQATSVSQNIYKMGQIAMQLLLDAIGDPENHEPQGIVIETD